MLGVSLHSVRIVCRPQYNSGPRVFSNRTCVTPPSTDGAVHSLTDESETVRFIAYGTCSHLVLAAAFCRFTLTVS